MALKGAAPAGFGVIRRSKAAAPRRERVALDVLDMNKPGYRARSWTEAAFETARMYTGPAPVIDRAGLFGVASFEFG